MLEIPKDKLEQAILIVERVTEELENGEDGCVGFEADFEGDDLWIRDDGENINTDHVVTLAQELLDELEIDAPFVFSWAFTCSKPRVDEFGGGACAVRRGKDPIWVDARDKVEQELVSSMDRPKDEAAKVDLHRAVNVKVSRCCGWINFEPGWWRHPKNKTACEEWDLPDYMNDLNACREMEATLRPSDTYACEKWWWYRSNLIDICNAESKDEFKDHLDATASQRTRAFLRTMEEPNIDRS